MQTLNNYFLKRATVVYAVSVIFVGVLYFGYFMPWYWALMGFLEVILFYWLSTYWEKKWNYILPVQFEKKLFGVTLLFRFIWIIGYYLFTTSVWHTPWEQPIGVTMDSTGYFAEGQWIKEMITQGDLFPYFIYLQSRSISDSGYPVFLALWSFLTGDNIFLTRIPNAFFDAWTVVLTYRISKRNFGDKVARLSALFTLLIPMLSFYSAVTMKESLMLMLSIWAIDRGDFIIRERQFKSWNLLAFAVLVVSVTLFRTALAWVIVLSFLCALVFSSERILNRSRRVALLFIVVFVGATFYGGRIMEQGEELLEQAESTGANFEYRANRKGGNALVANLSKAFLAPLLITLPFPTMVEIEGQNIQQLQNGGYYLKNILSFFCIFALFSLLPKKRWNRNVMIIAFFIGYLMALGMSSFAQSGRFHHPVLPIEMIFGAYGISQIHNYKQAKWFDFFLLFEFCIIIFWNWFKLRGRGII